MMEMDTLPHHHRHRHHRPGNNAIYLILGAIVISPLIWQLFGSDKVGQWHPFYDVIYYIDGVKYEGYTFSWYLTLTFIRTKTLLWPIIAILAKPRHYNLIYIYIGYELIMLIDHFLFYEQASSIIFGVQIGMRVIIAPILAIYMVYYHYKYEHIKE